ncbi:MAG: hypothetical protein HYV90_03740 [Candidatus Woesebacteria bacterium]|nr:MAG: hypothetical protein HYV90_03740 [Candidatus Woesebacteria bacterium]
MLKVRYILRLVGAFVARFRTLIIIGILIGVGFFFVLKFLLPVLSGGAVERIGITGRFTTNNLPVGILRLIGDGLTKLDATGNVEPNLAASWETPDRGKTWIFHLRKDITWQDGVRVTSSGISYQFSDVTTERPDDSTIIFKLQTPYSAFPAVLARPVFRKGLLGTGEWDVKKLSVNISFVDSLTLEKKDSGKIIYKFYPTEEKTKLAFELGLVDKVTDIFNPSPLNTWKKAKVETFSNTGEYVAVFFNTQDKILADKSLRQALSYAIDKERLGELRAVGPISMDSWAYNSQVKPYNFDLDKAKEIIADYKKAAKIEKLEVSLTTAPILLGKAEMIAKDWESAGVAVNLQVFSGVPSDYQALLAIFDIPDDPDQYSIWHSTQTATNITRYQNPRIDKLLEDGRSQINIEDRRKTYLDFQRYLVEDSPAAFLYFPTTYTISR